MSHLQDLEDSLNITTYLRQYNESYRGINFRIIQTTDFNWRVMCATQVLIQKNYTYEEAFAYAKGYFDGCIEYGYHDD